MKLPKSCSLFGCGLPAALGTKRVMSLSDDTKIDRDELPASNSIDPAIAPRQDPENQTGEVDLKALAKEVYALMKKELKLERQRAGMR